MRAIHKRKEPIALIEYRLKAGALYDGDASFTPVKDKIRLSLLAEQGFLCAYCMQRISMDAMKVEHWQCQANHPTAQLDYQNMLGACTGNEGQPPRSQTCDTRKGNADLAYNPADPTHRIEARIRYLANGRVESSEPMFAEQIEDVLNLNYSRLVENRKAVVKSVLKALDHREGRRTATEIRKVLQAWLEPDANHCLPAYSGVAVYLLKKRLARAS